MKEFSIFCFIIELECIKIYANTFINEIDTKHLCIIIDKDKKIHIFDSFIK